MLNRSYLLMASIGRSGSTAMRSALGKHPDIYYNGRENNQIQDIVACAWKNKTMASRQYAMVVSESTYDLQYAELIRQLTWPKWYKRLLRKTLMCAINPEPEHSNYLFDLMPNAKMLYLVRDGVDVICSRQRFQSFQHYCFEEHCNVWMQSIAMAAWVEANPDKARIFRYEWMLHAETLEDELRKTFAFCGLAYSKNVIQHILSHRYHPTSGGPKGDDWANISEQQRTRIASTAKGWTTWSEAERSTFERICGEAMTRLGYEIPWSHATHSTHAV